MTDLFQNVATLARQQALPGLKARAEASGLIISVCSGCFAYLGEQDGLGVTGLSHGYCPTCLEEFSAEIASSEGGLREGAEEDAVPSHFSSDSEPLEERCELGEPMMHGPEPYRWCKTHDRLMLMCEERSRERNEQRNEQVAEPLRSIINGLCPR